jgi:transcriptional regulator with XRE-family HTH domain
MSLAQIIRSAREAAGFSQRELAARIGVHQSAIGQWELGQANPGTGHRISLAIALDIRFQELDPGLADRVAVVTDPDIVAVVRLIERMPREQCRAFLLALALLVDHPDQPPASDPVKPPQRPQRAV